MPLQIETQPFQFKNTVTASNTLTVTTTAVSAPVNQPLLSIYGAASASTYLQVQNTVATLTASTDISVYNDQGYYLDMGINSSKYNGNSYYSGRFNIVGPNDGYVYNTNGNLALGTANPVASSYVSIFAGGTLSGSSAQGGNEIVRFVSGGKVGIGTTAPNQTLTVVGSISASNTVYANGVQLGSGYTVSPTTSSISPTYSVSTVGGNNSVVAGGCGNNISGASHCSIIGAGVNNCVIGAAGGVLNGCNNFACGTASAVIGGLCNVVGSGSHCSTIIGGVSGSIANVCTSSIIAGCCNCIGAGASSNMAVIGGAYNMACATHSVIAGGCYNCTISYGSFIAGGSSNLATNSNYSTIIGTVGSRLSGNAAGIGNSVIIGSCNSITTGGGSVVIGGFNNLAGLGGCTNSTLINTYGSQASGSGAVAFGGFYQCTLANRSTIAGGQSNTICNGSDCSFIAGGCSNRVGGYPFGSITGGNGNQINNWYGFIGNGLSNQINGLTATIVNGFNNSANGNISFIGTGARLCTNSNYNIVLGGVCNYTGAGGSDFAYVFSGCCNNTANSQRFSGVVGGCCNTASGAYSSILGGTCNNLNNQSCSFIIGNKITATSPNYTYVNNLSSQGMVYGNLPVFAAYGATPTFIPNSTSTKMIFDVKTVDTNNNYSTVNSRFTPTVAGYYQFNSSAQFSVSATNANASIIYVINQNGVGKQRGNRITLNTSGIGTTLSTILSANGSTDYFEIFAIHSAGAGNNIITESSGYDVSPQFSASFIRGL